MGKEESLIDKLKGYVFSEGENICYFGIDLITEEYDPLKLAEIARKNGLAQRLGYLAEVCAQAARDTNIPEQKKLTSLYEALEDSFKDWEHLNPLSPEWGKRIDMHEHNQTELNKKWKIYTTLRPEEIEDWIDLYVTRDFQHFNPYKRWEMAQKGIKYTRILRKDAVY